MPRLVCSRVLCQYWMAVSCRRSPHPWNPKDTRAFVMLGRHVVKDYSGFALHLLGIKSIFHQHEVIDIVRLMLRRHKGPKNDKPSSGPSVCPLRASRCAKQDALGECSSQNGRSLQRG